MGDGGAYDVVCVGGGTAGMSAARAAAFHGARVALVEREGRLGGECTFTGCVPSKTLIHAATVFWRARNSAHLGIAGEAVRLDFARLMRRVAAVVDEIARDERDEVFVGQGIDVFHGPARVAGPGVVAVGGRTLKARAIVVATGSEPAMPLISGLRDAKPLTSETVFGLREQPERLVIIGGGPVGVELAQAFQRLGTRVSLLAGASRLLPREEPETSACVLSALRRDGVAVYLGARAERVEPTGDGVWRVHAGGVAVDCDRILLAVGREARVAGLGLEQLGVAVDERIVVDERCRTSVEGIYAAGDCASPYRFTHVAAHEGRVAGTNAAGKRATVDHDAVPWVTFVDPEVARVGLTEEQARARYGSLEIVSLPMSRVDRARCMGETQGFIKIIVASRGPLGGAIVHSTGGRVVGAHIVGVHAGEVLGEVSLAMHAKTFAGRIAQTMHAYPTVSLGLQQAVAQLFPAGRAQIDTEPHTPATDR